MTVVFKLTKFAICIFLLLPLAYAQGQKAVDPETSKLIDNMVGKVELVRGKVIKIRADNKKEISIGTANQIVQEGDEIVTKGGSLIKIKMIDDTMISLGPNSRLKFTKFKFISKGNRTSVYEIVAGKLRANIPVKAKAGDLTYKTPTSSLGIRGTVFLTNVGENAEGQQVTQHAVLEGKVQVENHSNGEKANITPGNQYVSIESGKEVVDSGTVTMDKEDVKYLMESDDFAKEFPKLLKQHEGHRVARASSNAQNSERNSKASRAPASSRSWRTNMDKLNEKLDEYNQ